MLCCMPHVHTTISLPGTQGFGQPDNDAIIPLLNRIPLLKKQDLASYLRITLQ